MKKKHFLAQAFTLAMVLNCAFLMSEARAKDVSSDHKNWDASALNKDALPTASVDQENAFIRNTIRKSGNSDLNLANVLIMLSSVGFGIHALGYLCRRKAQGTTKPQLGCAIEAAYLNSTLVNQKSNVVQKESIEQLIVKNSHLKRDAINVMSMISTCSLMK